MKNDLDNMRPPRKRRLTPADADWVIEDWLRLERSYMNHGLSANEAYIRISQQYHCSPRTIHHHLQKIHNPNRVKPKSTPYSEIVKRPAAIESVHRRQREYKRFSRNPEHYLISIFKQSDSEAMTLESISLKIEEQYRFLPRIGTLEAVSKRLHEKYGHPVLAKIPGSVPPAYRLTIDY